MKKLLLLFCFLASTAMFAQSQFNQPSQFNNVCDDNGDGFAEFYMQEITFEIIANATDFTVTHHLTQTDASTGANPLPFVYTNVTNPQLIFARIVNNISGEVTILTYDLNVIQQPTTRPVTLTNCSDVTTSFPCWNLNSMVPEILNGLSDSFAVGFYQTESDAISQTNIIINPFCYISPVASPTQPPVFYRLDNGFGCSAIGMVYLVTIDCEPCVPPVITVTNVGTNDLVLISNTTASEVWEYVCQIAGGPPPNQGEFAENPTTIITWLNCGTTYEIYARKYCSTSMNQVSVWSSPMTITTLECGPQFGQPISFYTCNDTVIPACFNLTDNNVNIMGTVDPTNYVITYHISETDAQNNINPLSSPFCIEVLNFSVQIFARVSNTSNSEFFITIFSVNVRSSDYGTSLQTMTQCDEDENGVVVFDLTTASAEINSTNQLLYFTNTTDAENGSPAIAIANSSTFELTAGFSTTVYVREVIDGVCDLIYAIPLNASGNCNLASDCASANSLCASLDVPFANTTNVPSAGTQGCLFTTPNPTWFYLPISEAGTINLMIQQSTDSAVSIANLDADYIVYGPFSDPVTPCESILTSENIAACSYSASPIEYPILNNAQPGQYYLLMVTNFSNNPGYIKITDIGGTGTGAIDCSGFRLNAFLDTNSNGTKDVGENGFPLGQFSYEKNDNGVIHNVISPSGIYNLYEINPLNSYDVSYAVDADYSAMYNVTIPSYSNITAPAGSGMVTYNFPVTVEGNYNDLAISIIPISPPRPGFTYDNKIVYTNYGNQTMSSGTITFTKEEFASIVSVSVSGYTLTADGFTYTFNDLMPFESREIFVTMIVALIPTVELGQYLTTTASIEPIANDVVPANNSATNSQIIIGSYDPNDKMEAHGEKILYSNFTNNDYLTYTIRFENSGTASAINVRVNDVLNNQLDPTSIKMISSSHDYIMDRVDNSLIWRFENIQLPPSIENTSIGKGYITFKVKPRAGFAIGDIIPNTASIFFDYNPAIVTNTFNTEFVQQLSVIENENTHFVMYPNPAKDTVIINSNSISSTIASIKISDVLGKIIISKTSNQSTETLDVSGLNSGMYFVEIITEKNDKAIKKLIIK